jgi:hypothetical protein
LATAVADDPDIFAGCESIRSAVKKLNESDETLASQLAQYAEPF